MKLSCCFSVLLLVAAGNSIIVPDKYLEGGGPYLGTDQGSPVATYMSLILLVMKNLALIGLN